MKCVTVFICSAETAIVIFRSKVVVKSRTARESDAASGVIAIRDFQRFIENRQTRAHVLGCSGTRRQHVRAVEVDEWPQTAFLAGCAELLHGFGGLALGIEGQDRKSVG